jgi:hypothetical protein
VFLEASSAVRGMVSERRARSVQSSEEWSVVSWAASRESSVSTSVHAFVPTLSNRDVPHTSIAKM